MANTTSQADSHQTHLLLTQTLPHLYQGGCGLPNDKTNYVSHLSRLAAECTSVAEFGLCEMYSTWGLLNGFKTQVDNSVQHKLPQPTLKYVGYDVVRPRETLFTHARNIATALNVEFQFVQGDTLDIKTPFPTEVDLLFIDTTHTYCHLTAELHKYHSRVRHYLCMHDTDAPYGFQDQPVPPTYYDSFPSTFDKTKRGCLAAVTDFVASHPDEWLVAEKYTVPCGFVVLKRIAASATYSSSGPNLYHDYARQHYPDTVQGATPTPVLFWPSKE